MASLKISLEAEELAVVERVAKAINTTPEDLAFYALDRLMLEPDKPSLAADIHRVTKGRKDNLSRWSDPASTPHAYESKPSSSGEKKPV